MSFNHSLTSGRVLLMDAAMGTQLGSGATAPWKHIARVRAIHAAAAEAGAEVILTATFQTNPIALAQHHLEDQLETLIARSITAARLAAPGKFVLGDVGPILSPGSRHQEFADRDALVRTLSAFRGVDGILFETCSTPAVLSAVQFALHRVCEVEDLPLLASLTYHRDSFGQLVTFSGHGPEVHARHAVRHGVSALGVNCGKDMTRADLAEILTRYRRETDLPLFVRPNAGTPDAAGSYPIGPADFAAMVPALLAAGATMIGGCCGTTAEHIRAAQRTISSTARATS